MSSGDAHAGQWDSVRRDLADAREQLGATSEILTAFGGSASDRDAVLATIVDSAQRLCRADGSQLYLADGEVYRLTQSAGVPTDVTALVERQPVTRDHGSLTGRVGEERSPQLITDALTDPAYVRVDYQRLAGNRSMLGVPMILDGDLVGVLSVFRRRVDPFDERDTALLTTFAAQAAVAVGNVQLVRTLEERSTELARRVAQLEALGDVGDAVASTLDLDQVLDTIVAKAVQLSETDGGSLMEFDEQVEEFFVRTAYQTSPHVLEALKRTSIHLHRSFVGRAALEGRPLQLHDLRDADLDNHLRVLADAGWRSLVAVPIMREDRVVGVLVVRRLTPGSFSDETCDLLETFASQSALTILNARLFGELEQKRAELEAVSQHKSDFLASMSHELRTPLNAVIGFSEVLLDRMFGDLNDRQKEYLEDIRGSGQHLLDLLNEILDLSKVEAGQMEFEHAPFSVREVLVGGMSLMRERAARHRISLELEVAEDVGIVEVDELRFKQVVLNLLTNAVKFTPDGGRVSVRSWRAADEVVVTVTDTGPGIAPQDRSRIFESFQQGGRGIRSEEGTGLGLTLSRRIVDLLGGRLWLESEVGVGSTFGFTIPNRAVERDTTRTSEPSAGDRQHMVLVIEDDRSSLGLMTLYLEGAGYAVATARDGVEGLDAARRLLPAAIVLDIRLPRVDGWAVLAALKNDPATAAVPVVVVTMVDQRARGLALGAAEYLIKPVHRQDVVDALARACRRAVPDGSVAQ